MSFRRKLAGPLMSVSLQYSDLEPAASSKASVLDLVMHFIALDQSPPISCQASWIGTTWAARFRPCIP
eukprot:10275744-Alexandrium_andersonii.AAC.1